jgi:hypothetical protein
MCKFKIIRRSLANILQTVAAFSRTVNFTQASTNNVPVFCLLTCSTRCQQSEEPFVCDNWSHKTELN